jgi:adenylate cyclase class 2
MTYEVERKFRLQDPEALLRQATAAGVHFGSPITQTDEYFAHPARDFASTDEALRVRMTDGQCRITYKGPKLSAATKTRHEIELPFADSVRDPGPVGQLLLALGFRSVLKVRKQRRSAQVAHGHWQFSMDLDDVQGLGTFVELDTTATEEQISAAERAMAAIAEEYGLSGDVTTSYLDMLLAAQTSQE